MAVSLKLTRVHLPLVVGMTCFQFGYLPSTSLVMKVQHPDSSFTQPGTASLAGLPFLASSASSPGSTLNNTKSSPMKSRHPKNCELGSP